MSQAALYDPVVALLSRLSGEKQSLEEATLELAGLAPGEKVLDVGCGTGTLAITAHGHLHALRRTGGDHGTGGCLAERPGVGR